ncbi:hypothetical protein ACWC4A_51950 [Streptomyces mirabilis]
MVLPSVRRGVIRVPALLAFDAAAATDLGHGHPAVQLNEDAHPLKDGGAHRVFGVVGHDLALGHEGAAAVLPGWRELSFLDDQFVGETVQVRFCATISSTFLSSIHESAAAGTCRGRQTGGAVRWQFGEPDRAAGCGTILGAALRQSVTVDRQPIRRRRRGLSSLVRCIETEIAVSSALTGHLIDIVKRDI